MKKLVNPRPIPNGGLPLYGGDLIECTQTEIYRAIAAGYKQYAQPVIIHGCVITADTGAGTCTITSGMVFLNGDFIDTPAYSGTYPVYLAEAAVTTVSKNYKDQTPRPVTVQKNTSYLNAAPGSGEYITFNPFTSQYLKDVRRRTDTPLGRVEWFPDFPNPDAFDVNGVGKWEWLGFVHANGYDGSTDMSGAVAAGFIDSDPQFIIGDKIGARNTALLKTNLPNITIGIPTGSSGAGSGKVQTGSGSPDGTQLTDPLGDGTPFSVIQETVVGVWIQRK